MAWMRRVGFIGEDGSPTEAEFRDRVYFTAMTKCYPGPGTKGDRRPTPKELSLCRPHLEEPLRLLESKAGDPGGRHGDRGVSGQASPHRGTDRRGPRP